MVKDLPVDLISMASEQGFSAAALMEVDQVPLNGDFRQFCEQNACGYYNANYSCPPTCGTFEQMRDRLHAYKNALFLQSRWYLPDLSDKKSVTAVRKTHNEHMMVMAGVLNALGISTLICGSSSCLLCEQCADLSGEPCRNPNLAYSCLSAYCVDVFELCKTLGWDASYKDGYLTFYGILAF